MFFYHVYLDTEKEFKEEQKELHQIVSIITSDFEFIAKNVMGEDSDSITIRLS